MREATVAPFRDHGGTVVGAVLVLRDTAADVARSRAEGVFRELVESTGDMLARHDSDGRHIYVSLSSALVTYVNTQLDLTGANPSDRVSISAQKACIMLCPTRFTAPGLG